MKSTKAMKKFGKELKAEREAMEVTQEEFGESLGVTGVYIGKLEKGTRRPSMSFMLQLLQEHGIYGPCPTCGKQIG